MQRRRMILAISVGMMAGCVRDRVDVNPVIEVATRSTETPPPVDDIVSTSPQPPMRGWRLAHRFSETPHVEFFREGQWVDGGEFVAEINVDGVGASELLLVDDHIPQGHHHVVYRKDGGAWTAIFSAYVWGSMNIVPTEDGYDLSFEEDIGSRMPPDPAFSCWTVSFSPEGAVQSRSTGTHRGETSSAPCAPLDQQHLFARLHTVTGSWALDRSGPLTFRPDDSSIPPVELQADLASEIRDLHLRNAELGPDMTLQMAEQPDGWHALDWQCLGSCQHVGATTGRFVGGGTEPFWGIDLRPDGATVSFPMEQTTYTFSAETHLRGDPPWTVIPDRSNEALYGLDQPTTIRLTREVCDDGTSSDLYSYSVAVNNLKGCAQPY
ncbi:MAG: hypothetical protein AAFV53_28180 [Myxococcota bacterium]